MMELEKAGFLNSIPESQRRDATMNGMTRTLAAAALLLFMSGDPSADAVAPRCTRGTASYYGREHEGRTMANGQAFRARGHTAASRTLPLGVRVWVWDLDHGTRELVIITDRGPYVTGRIIDLSVGTAQRLGFEHAGLAEVAICPGS